MATVTPNFNWPVPTSTDLVKDGATAIEALGDSIDASLVDLKGGTTGQVLSKNSNTDMDFTWVTDAAGDIQGVTVTSPLTGGGTSGTVTVGILSGTTSNLGAVQLSDSTSSTSTTLAATANAVKQAYDPAFTNNFYAGKNKIINGNMNIWQRGTSINIAAASFGYGADRWGAYVGTGGAVTISRQTFTPGAAPVAGYESNYFLRYNRTTTGSAESYLYQRIEDVTTYAGQTVTVSFWAKVGSAVTFPIGDIYLEQNFGTGGSTAVTTNVNTSTQAISTSWTRYSFTVAVPSISGKTIGTSSQLGFVFRLPTSFSTVAFDLWGVQLEAGSTATPFQTATGTIQGELAACQRYFQKTNNQSETPGAAPSSTPINCLNASSTLVVGVPPFKVSMRVSPTVTLYSPVTGTTGKIRSGGADITASVGDVGEYTIGYISATGLTAGSNSSIAFTADAEL